MKCVEVPSLGDPVDVLILKDVPSVSLKDGEVRVKVLASPIHPSNLLQVAGLYGVKPPLPFVPGSEGIGEVVEVATDVTRLAVGQNVLLLGAGGTWREEMVGPAAAFIPVPAGDVEQLSMVAINPMTAHLLLATLVDLKEGDWVMQSGANSAVGEMLIQLAKQRGIKTVNVVRREGLATILKDLGADVVVVDGPDLKTTIKAATDGAKIGYAIDCVGGDTFSRLVECLAPGGTIASYGMMSRESPTLNLGTVIFKDIHVRGFWLSQWYETASSEAKAAAFGALIPMVLTGKLKTRIDARFPLEDIKAAAARANEGGRDGKVLLIPNRF